MSCSRACLSLLLAAGMLAGNGLLAFAQNATTENDGALDYSSLDGKQAGAITIREIADDFTGFTPGAPPGPGQRFVALTVRFEAADDKPFDAEPSRILIQDNAGFIYTPTDISRPPDALPLVVRDQVLQPGDRVTGLIGFVLPADAVIDEILYSPTPIEDETIEYRPRSGARLLNLVDEQPSDIPAPGTAVSDASPDGSYGGTVTFRGITDPFTPFIPSSAPGDVLPKTGMRYVLVEVVFEAAADKLFEAAPWYIVLHDTEGNQWGFADVSLPPDAALRVIPDRKMGPDDRVSGVVGIAVPAAAVIDEVLYEPPYEVRRIPLANLTTEQ